MGRMFFLITSPTEKVREAYYRERFATYTRLEITTNAADALAVADEIETLGGWGMSDGLIKAAANLKWLHHPISGTDHVEEVLKDRDDVILTSSRGIHGPLVSEAAISLMLSLARDLPFYVRNQDQARWEKAFPSSRLLYGKTVGIYGVGVIGAALAERCKAFGMTVIGITATKRYLPGFDEMVNRSELPGVLPKLDHLVILLPLTEENRNAVDAGVFALMKPSAYFINVARGGVVDEGALIEALRAHRIAGAALDVTVEEPLPPDSPLWKLDNVVLTPRTAGHSDNYGDFMVPIFEENMRCYLDGDIDGMVNLVKRPKLAGA